MRPIPWLRRCGKGREQGQLSASRSTQYRSPANSVSTLTFLPCALHGSIHILGPGSWMSVPGLADDFQTHLRTTRGTNSQALFVSSANDTSQKRCLGIRICIPAYFLAVLIHTRTAGTEVGRTGLTLHSGHSSRERPASQPG